MLTIRHANESERIDVADIMKKRAGETLDLSTDDIVIASQGDELLGFAVLKTDARGMGGCLSLSGGRLHRGIGREVLRHLFDHSAARYIYADRIAAQHLLGLGFKRESASAMKEAGGILRNTCTGRGKGSSVFARTSQTDRV
jgi:hypothetical protein